MCTHPYTFGVSFSLPWKHTFGKRWALCVDEIRVGRRFCWVIWTEPEKVPIPNCLPQPGAKVWNISPLESYFSNLGITLISNPLLKFSYELYQIFKEHYVQVSILGFKDELGWRVGRGEGEATNWLKVSNALVWLFPEVFLPLGIRLNESFGYLKREQEEEREIEDGSWGKGREAARNYHISLI